MGKGWVWERGWLDLPYFKNPVRKTSPLYSRYQMTYGWGGKRGGRKTSRITPLQKKVLGAPWSGTFSTPSAVVALFSCFEVQDSAHQKLFWRAGVFFWRVRCLVRFPPPIRLHPPYHGPKISRHSDDLSLRGLNHLEVWQRHHLQETLATLMFFVLWHVCTEGGAAKNATTFLA